MDKICVITINYKVMTGAIILYYASFVRPEFFDQPLINNCLHITYYNY